MSRHIDEACIKAIFNALPAASYQEIAYRSGMPIQSVGHYLGCIRDRGEQYGWTVPHAKRGRSHPDRFRVVLVPMNGDTSAAIFGEDDQASLEDGLTGTLRVIITTGTREARALRMAMPLYEANDPPFAHEISEIEDTLSFAARRAAAALARLNANA